MRNANIEKVCSRWYLNRCKKGAYYSVASILQGMRITLILIFAFALLGCAKPPLEEQIYGVVSEMETALEARKPSAVLDHVSEDFTANEYLDKRRLHQFLIKQFFQNKHIEVILSDVAINPVPTDPGRAHMQGGAMLLGGEGLVDKARIYNIEATWVLSDGDWLLERIKWE